MITFQFKKILFVFEFYIICVVLCQDNCQQKCWKGRPGTRVYYGSQIQNVSSENDCKDLCANNGTCVGIDWDNNQGSSDYGCWFHMTPTNNYSPGSGIYHWDLVNCSDDCLSYCWKPLKNNSGIWDAEPHGPMDENRCKLLCSQRRDCTGVDWITDNTQCWLINFVGVIHPRNGIHHWDIVKNISKNCQPITSTTSTNPTSVQIQVSTSPLSDVPSATGREESLKAGVIAMAVLSGVFLGVSIALAVVLFRTTRQLRDQSSSSSNVKEPERTYESLQLDTRSQTPAPVYTDLQSIS